MSGPVELPDTLVLAYNHGLDPDKTKDKKETEYVDDMTPFQSHSRAVHEDAEGGVRKDAVSMLQNMQTSATIYVNNTGEREVEADTDSGRPESMFADIKDVDVKHRSGVIEDQTDSHLADLGYL